MKKLILEKFKSKMLDKSMFKSITGGGQDEEAEGGDTGCGTVCTTSHDCALPLKCITCVTVPGKGCS